jgi:hypothetical protein
LGYSFVYWFRPSDALKERLATYRLATAWNRNLDPIAFVERGVEPDVEAIEK